MFGCAPAAASEEYGSVRRCLVQLLMLQVCCWSTCCIRRQRGGRGGCWEGLGGNAAGMVLGMLQFVKELARCPVQAGAFEGGMRYHSSARKVLRGRVRSVSKFWRGRCRAHLGGASISWWSVHTARHSRSIFWPSFAASALPQALAACNSDMLLRSSMCARDGNDEMWCEAGCAVLDRCRRYILLLRDHDFELTLLDTDGTCLTCVARYAR